MEPTKAKKQDDQVSSSSSPPSRTKLPPPPKFDPSSLPVFSSALPVSGLHGETTTFVKSSGGPSLSASSLIENLPRPPPLPIKKSSSTSSSFQVGSSNTHTSTAPILSQKDEIEERVHETLELIPPLVSAPPSASMAIVSLSDANKESKALQQEEGKQMKSSTIVEDTTFSARSWLPPKPISPSSSVIEPKNSLPSITSTDDENDLPAPIPTHKNVPKTQKNRNVVHPPHHILTYSQRSIPILILSTPSADAIAAKNHLSLSEFMNGLANSISSASPSLAGKLPPIRSITRLIDLSWDNLRLNFYDLKSSNDKNHQDWERRFQNAVQIWPEDEGKSLDVLEEQIETHFRSHGQKEKALDSWDPECANSRTTPWLSRFHNGINQLTDRSPYTMIHCPPVVLFIASTSDGIKGLLNLTEKKNLPVEYQNGLFDPNGFKGQYLMLHDEKDGPTDLNEASMSEDLLKIFGHDSVSLVRINGGDAKCIEDEDSIWDEFIPPSIPMENDFKAHLKNLRGTHLHDRDKLAIRRFISRMLIKAVIPVMERRIQNLNVEVTNNKKGVKNVFKSLWRKPKEGEGLSESVHGRDQPNKSNIVAYRYDTIESRTRLLADTLFLIRDFDAAHGIYRLVKDDYKYDQQLMMSALVHEMMALCVFLHDLSSGNRNTREVLQHFDSALYLYSSAAEEYRVNTTGTRPSETTFPTRCSTRVCLLLSSSKILSQERELETADSLAAASSKETPLAAAILLEQSASHYYQAGMVRKFAFHMLMAGHMFRSAGQDYHSVRCFASSMYVYHHGNRFWNELFNHLTSALAGQLYLMRRMRLCLILYTKLLGTPGAGKVSVRSQQKFIDHLMAICRSHDKDSLESVHRIKALGEGSLVKEPLHDGSDALRTTPGAIEFLEIPGMNLPKILSSTIIIQNSSEHSNLNDEKRNEFPFGRSAVGSDEVWQHLICSSEAELDIFMSFSNLSLIEWSRLVIEKIDEMQKKHLAELRIRKKSSDPQPPTTRAKLEPITVSFRISNPLNVMIPVTAIQLVATLKCSKTHRVYTNQESIELCQGSDATDLNKKWKFSGSSGIFEIANFACVSPTTDSESEAWHSGYNENPFFLVTKSRIALEPGSIVDISLEICPLITGTLEILGLRCKLFNEIWVYNPFDTKGTLLHNTAFNRRNKVRAPSNLLRSKIDGTMPYLTFDIVRDEEIKSNSLLLQGQVSKWKIRISNQGAAPANNVILKTNLPWINILLEDGVIVDEKAAVSHCIGPSGTMMQLPLNRFSNSGKVGVLNPGQTVEVPIEIRTFGSGNQDFYMLFRYELFDKILSPKHQSSRHRYFRTMFTIPVYPSITLTASIIPSFKKQNEHILSIDITNYRSDRPDNLEVTPRRICIASKNYSIRPLLLNKNLDSEASNAYSAYKCGWQERATMYYILSPESTNDHICILSDAGRTGDENIYSSSDKTMIDFICLEHAHHVFSNSLKKYLDERSKIESENENLGKQPRSIAQIRRARSSLSSLLSEQNSDHYLNDPVYFHPTSRAALCASEHAQHEINLICSWTATGDNGDTIIFGQHHLTQLAVKPRHKSRSCPLTITAKFNPDMTHDFESGLLVLDIEICIQNRLAKSNVEFEFSLSGCMNFEFMGTCCFRRSISGGDHINLPLQVIIFRSGVHNIQGVHVTVYHTDGTETPFIFPMQWIVRVNSQ